MSGKKAFEMANVEKLLTPPEPGPILIPLSSIAESDHAFFWGALYLSIATSLFGCAVSLYASAYEHVPFIILLAVFGSLFFLLFLVFATRGVHIRRRARTERVRKSPRGVAGRGGVVQETINRVFSDGAARTREEVMGVLAGMSTEEVDVGTLSHVVDALVEAGMFTESESDGRSLLTYSARAA